MIHRWLNYVWRNEEATKIYVQFCLWLHCLFFRWIGKRRYFEYELNFCNKILNMTKCSFFPTFLPSCLLSPFWKKTNNHSFRKNLHFSILIENTKIRKVWHFGQFCFEVSWFYWILITYFHNTFSFFLWPPLNLRIFIKYRILDPILLNILAVPHTQLAGFLIPHCHFPP